MDEKERGMIGSGSDRKRSGKLRILGFDEAGLDWTWRILSDLSKSDGELFGRHKQPGHVQLVSVQRLVGTDDDFVTLRVGRVELDVLCTSSARAVWI